MCYTQNPVISEAHWLCVSRENFLCIFCAALGRLGRAPGQGVGRCSARRGFSSPGAKKQHLEKNKVGQ